MNGQNQAVKPVLNHIIKLTCNTCPRLGALLFEAMNEELKKAREAAYQKYGKPGFFFSEEDMVELLQAFYLGACPTKKKCQRCGDNCQRFRSRLDRLDQQDKLQKDKSILFDPSNREFGNPMLSAFTHDEVANALQALKKKVVRRAGQQLMGWAEYSLRVLCGKANPSAKVNAFQPEVRDKDKIKAMVLFSQELMPPEKETPEDLSDLFHKLSEK